MVRLAECSFTPSEQARELVLELAAYAACVDGFVTSPEVAALDGAALRLGATERPAAPYALLLDKGGLLPPRLHELSALERRVAFGAAAWIVYADGIECFAERAFLDFVAEEAGLGSDEAHALCAAAARAWRACDTHLPRSVEFELLVLEIQYLHALSVAERGPLSAPQGPDPNGSEAETDKVGSASNGRARWSRAS